MVCSAAATALRPGVLPASLADADLDPASVPALAALHRERAYNDGVRAGRWGAGGSVADRNVRMRVPLGPTR